MHPIEGLGEWCFFIPKYILVLILQYNIRAARQAQTWKKWQPAQPVVGDIFGLWGNEAAKITTNHRVISYILNYESLQWGNSTRA